MAARREGGRIALAADDRAQLVEALRREGRVRPWKRYRALLLLAEGYAPAVVAGLLLCSESSVYNWVTAWRRAGLDGLSEPQYVGRRPLLDAAGEQLLSELLRVGPDRSEDGAAPLTASRLQQELRRAGYDVDARTIRRVLHRLGWRWKGSGYVMTRLGAH